LLIHELINADEGATSHMLIPLVYNIRLPGNAKH